MALKNSCQQNSIVLSLHIKEMPAGVLAKMCHDDIATLVIQVVCM